MYHYKNVKYHIEFKMHKQDMLVHRCKRSLKSLRLYPHTKGIKSHSL